MNVKKDKINAIYEPKEFDKFIIGRTILYKLS